MRLLALIFILGLSASAYFQAERINELESSNDQLASAILLLDEEIGGVSNIAATLSGELQNVASIASSTAASTAELAGKETAEESIQRTVAEAAPAVVSISEFVPGEGEPNRTSAGTGFLVRSSGYIVTNVHVVDSLEYGAYYTAKLADGREITATVISTTNASDIAVLKIPGSGFPTLPLGDSSKLNLGQRVIAIGNALGQYSNSVSTGVISGIDRTITPKASNGTLKVLTGVIQTDAAINKGNSGGPLVNLDGEVIGVNVATVTNVENISFSIPSNKVKAILSTLGI